jgi:hypothetical protein
MINVLKRVDAYLSKSIFDFTTEDFNFDVRDFLHDIEDNHPDMLGVVLQYKKLAIDLTDQKRNQISLLKISVQSSIERLDNFEKGGFNGTHEQRRAKYSDLLEKIDAVLAQNKSTRA